jgi:predicted  nucleic acid-binding Zn-ribbon protein
VRLREALSAAEATLDAELARLESERAGLAAGVPPAVRATYEKLLASPRLGGQITARLASSTCGRCRVVLPISVAGRVRPDAEAAVQCPRCTRILLP